MSKVIGFSLATALGFSLVGIVLLTQPYPMNFFWAIMGLFCGFFSLSIVISEVKDSEREALL